MHIYSIPTFICLNIFTFTASCGNPAHNTQLKCMPYKDIEGCISALLKIVLCFQEERDPRFSSISLL